MTTESMTGIKPLTVTDTMLISSTVPESDYAAWSSLTTFALDAKCIVIATHKVYQSVQANNLDHAVTDTAWWIEVGPTNRWRCFDGSNSTHTAQATAAQYVIKPSNWVSAIAILNNSEVSTLRVRMTDPTYGAVYDTTTYVGSILNDASWYSFFIAPKSSKSSVVLTDIPNYPSATFTIDMVGTEGMAFGVLMLGQATSLGNGVLYGARVGIQDYSRKDTNVFGDTVLVVRAFSKRANFNLMLTAKQTDFVYEWLADVRATPVLWLGSSRYTSTVIYGIWQGFEITIQYFDYSDCSLEILGLT